MRVSRAAIAALICRSMIYVYSARHLKFKVGFKDVFGGAGMFFLFVCVECFAVSKGFSAVAAKVACVRVFDEVSFELRAVCALVGALRALELLDASVFACDVPFPGFVGDKGAGFAAEGAEHVFFAFGEFDVLSMRWASHPFGGYALDDEWEYACVSSWGIFLAGVAEDDFFEVAGFTYLADAGRRFGSLPRPWARPPESPGGRDHGRVVDL